MKKKNSHLENGIIINLKKLFSLGLQKFISLDKFELTIHNHDLHQRSLRLIFIKFDFYNFSAFLLQITIVVVSSNISLCRVKVGINLIGVIFEFDLKKWFV